MQLDQRFANGKAKAQPAGGIPCSLLKGIENAAELVRLDPRARVAHFHQQTAAGVRRPDEDLPLIGSEFHGIAHKVPENLTEACGIRVKLGVLRFDLLDQSVVALPAVRKTNGDRVTQDIVCIDKLLLQRELSAADTRQIEKIINEPRLDSDIPADGVDRLSNVWRTIFILFQQRYGATGQPVGGENRVNTTTAGGQSNSSVTTLVDGGWLVTWSSS